MKIMRHHCIVIPRELSLDDLFSIDERLGTLGFDQATLNKDIHYQSWMAVCTTNFSFSKRGGGLTIWESLLISTSSQPIVSSDGLYLEEFDEVLVSFIALTYSLRFTRYYFLQKLIVIISRSSSFAHTLEFIPFSSCLFKTPTSFS